MKTFIRTLKYLGCKSVFLTNAAGSLNPSMGPGQLMLIRDHLNFQGTNPLIGPNEDKEGPRFLPMENTYDAELSNLLKSTAHQLEIPLEEGVYLGVTGPCYETLAEVKAFHLLGADAVGMSTVPEAIVAHHCGLKVMGLSVITNSAAGLHPNSLSHEETLATAQKTAHKVCQLLEVFFKTLASEPPLFK
jgi:xanthosine phosphorylase